MFNNTLKSILDLFSKSYRNATTYLLESDIYFFNNMLELVDVIIIYTWAGRVYHYIMFIYIYIYIGYIYIYVYIYILYIYTCIYIYIAYICIYMYIYVCVCVCVWCVCVCLCVCVCCVCVYDGQSVTMYTGELITDRQEVG